MALTSTWQDKLSRLFTVSLSELNPFQREQSYVSLDIGSSSIKMVEVRTTGEHLELLNWGTVPTPAAAIQNNMVTEPERLGDVIRGLLEAKGVKARRAITAVPGPAVMIKRVTLPSQTPQDMQHTIMVEAGNFIPEDLENVNIDYQVVDQVDDNRQMEVLLVAAKKDIVSSYGEALRAAGLAPIIVDVDYFALDNMYELNYDPTPDQVVALVNIGARYSSMNILKGGRSTFTGDVPVGGRDITEALTRDLGVTADVAERLKAGKEVDGVSADQVSMALGPATDALIEEIHYALSFFWTAATDERIDALYISGGAAGIPELRQRLADRAEAPVEIADPLARVGFAPGIDVAAVRAHGSELAVAMGLAIRRPEDK